MKQYYILSLKHTSRADSGITLWGPNSQGYTIFIDRAGLYTESDRPEREYPDNVFVEKELVEKHMAKTVYGGHYGDALPNDPTVWAALKLDTKQMKPKKCATIKLSF